MSLPDECYCPECKSELSEEQTEALERDRVARALDAYALREGWSRMPSPEMFGGKWTFRGLGVGELPLCETPDEARAAAALAIEAAGASS